MDTKTIIDDIEERARKANISMFKLCKEAGVADTNINRWKRGETSPNFSTLKKLTGALDRIAPN